MDDRFNTFAGWALFSGIVALGLASVSARYFEADKEHRPHEMGYEIEGVESSDGGEEEVPLATLLAAADPTKGEQVFAKCKSCHTIDAGGANGIGPNLHGVMGEPVGKGAGGFAFSSALSGIGGSWNFDNMNEWLASPKAFAPGTKMTFAGLSKPEDRAALMVYLNNQGSNLPLPPPPAAAPAEEEAAAGDEAPGEGAEEAPAEGEAAAEAPAAE
ncbi:MAG: cytochrome c family protein [Novosphingobium sp.]|nr:cytochrome c family protein [Novosphingobium sp.]MCP5401708.1 cytochrome c family protein [Novosphingobium sp.]